MFRPRPLETGCTAQLEMALRNKLQASIYLGSGFIN